MAESIACKICSSLPMKNTIFVNHLLGKKHKKKANARKCLNQSINKCSLQINSNEYQLEKFAERILFKYLKFNVVDAFFFKNKVFIEFKTHEDATKALDTKIEIQNLKLDVTRVKEDKRKKPMQGGRSAAAPEMSADLFSQLDTTNHRLDPDTLIVRLVKEIELKPKDLQIREHIRSVVEQFLNPLFPGSRTFIFGSSGNNLGFRGCDVDMVADLGYDCWEGRRKGEAEKEAEKLTRYLAKELRKRGLGHNVIAIGRARVPIVKFHDAMYGLEVDLSFKNGMPIYNTDLIRLYSTAHAIVKPYMMLIRYWAKIQGIAGGGHPTELLTNYCLCLMMLLWLMIRMEPIVPSVGALQQGVPPVLIDGCNCNFRKDVDHWRRKYHSITLIDLVIEFFEFFGQLDCKEFVLSPLNGSLIPRDHLKKNNKPLGSNFREEKFTLQLNTPMCVQDPFDTSHNVSRGFRDGALNVFQQKCLKALEICKNIRAGSDPVSALFAEYVLDDIQLNNLNTGVDINDVSIVDEVLSVSSNDSVELLQELESLERSGGLKELMEHANGDLDPDDKRSESPSQDSSDSVILCEESINTFSKISSTKNSFPDNFPSSENNLSPKNSPFPENPPSPLDMILQNELEDEEIVILGAVSQDAKTSDVKLVNLDETLDSSSDSVVVYNGSSHPSDGTEESRTSILNLSRRTQLNLTVTKESVELVSSEPGTLCSPSSKEMLLNPMDEKLKFSFAYYSQILFSIDTEGAFLPTPHIKSKDFCISNLLSFILKRVFLCDVVEECPPKEEEPALHNKEEKKRKNVENYSSNKALKLSDGDFVAKKFNLLNISAHKYRTQFPVWCGRKKLPKNANHSNLNPLQNELSLTEKLIALQKPKECHFEFETSLWKETTKLAEFWVTVNPCQSNGKKLDKSFDQFFIFLSKFISNLMHKIDGHQLSS